MKAIALAVRSPICHSCFRCSLLLISLVFLLVCFALCQMAQAVTPAPDGGYAGNNTAEGTSALFSLSSGVDNTALGFQALYHNTTSNYNTADGFRALFSNTTGTQNTATGLQALFSNTTASYNTANGVNTLFHNINGAQNTATGANALTNNTSGTYNTADGVNTLYRNTTGTQNTATGVQALFFNTGSFNTADGVNALYRNTIGTQNTAIGVQALFNNTSGSGNIALGKGAGINLTVGSNNIDIGNPGFGGESGVILLGAEGTHTDTFLAGRIHIGLASDPAFKIEPSDGSPHAGFVRFGDNTGWTLHFTRSREMSGGPLNTGITGAIMTLQDNGNVGIGTPFPSTRLDVRGAGLDPSTPSGHVVRIYEVGDSKTAGLAIQTTTVAGFSPSLNNFITFFDGNSASLGSIEANGSGGVQLGGAGSDYAEYLLKDDPAEEIVPGQIVSVRNGRIVARGAPADHYMVVTNHAIVAGNRPSEEEADLAKRGLVCFIGQVPVQVGGPVKSGDFILASEKEDGTGIAMPARSITPDAMHRVVGRAWESSNEEGLKTINTVVGLDQTSLAAPVLERLACENRELRATNNVLATKIAAYEEKLTALEARDEAREARLTQLENVLAKRATSTLVANASLGAE